MLEKENMYYLNRHCNYICSPFFDLWNLISSLIVKSRDGSEPVVECLTQDRGVAGSSLTGVTVLCPRARHINPCLVLVQPGKSCPNGKIVDFRRKESNQTNK